MNEGDGCAGHDSGEIINEISPKVRSRLRKVTEQAYEEKQQRKQREEKIVRELRCAPEDIVVLNAPEQPFELFS